MEQQPNKRQLQREHTLEKLRNAIDKQVNEVGYEKTTIRGICNEAGVATGAFYHYFASKDDVLMDRFVRYSQYILSFYEIEMAKEDPIEGIKDIVCVFEAYMLSRVPSILLEYRKAILTEYRKWSKGQEDALCTVVAALAQKGQELGCITDAFTPAQIATAVWTMTNGLCFTHCMREVDYLQKNSVLPQLLHFIESMRVLPLPKPYRTL